MVDVFIFIYILMEKTNIYLNLFFVHFAYFAIFSTLLFDI